MHLSICNLDILPPTPGHLTPSPSPGVGNLTLEPLRGWGIWHQAVEDGEFDRSYTTSEEEILSDLAAKIPKGGGGGGKS